jgi:hypothetical protein
MGLGAIIIFAYQTVNALSALTVFCLAIIVRKVWMKNAPSQSKQPHTSGQKRQIEYLPPDNRRIDEYANRVATALFGRFNTEFAREFSHFMKIVARIEAKNLTQGAANVYEKTH